MQLKITKINGREVTLKDARGKTEKLDILEIADIQEGSAVTIDIQGRPTRCIIEQLSDSAKAIVSIPQSNGASKMTEMNIRDIIGIHIGQTVQMRVIAEFEM